jgi:hypothetical protein
MIKGAIEKIEEMSMPVIDIEGVRFSNKYLIEVKQDPEPAPKVLYINTLSGLVDYIKNHPDNSKSYMIHIEDYKTVSLYGEYEKEFGRRKFYAQSKFDSFEFVFDSFYDRENLNIKLQTQFHPEQNREKLLAFVGNVKDEILKQEKDDGITQQVTIKAGIAKVDSVEVPNPVELFPRRTFSEIEPIKSYFVFRMKKFGDSSIQGGLFQADGGHWESLAILGIKDWLQMQLQLDDDVLIIA